jgi:hypothetical protein
MQMPPNSLMSLPYEALIGKQVDVYWNLHKQCWSVRRRGRLEGHAHVIGLEFVQWIVQPAGRERVRREKKKYVHAFARGLLRLHVPPIHPRGNKVTYNPYTNNCFVDQLGAVHDSYYAYLTVGADHRPEAHAIGVIR